MRKMIAIAILVALPLETLSAAEDSLLRKPLVADEAAPAEPVGTQTRAWIDLQQSNAAASATPRPQSGEVADRVYERYLKSYEQPIPQSFKRDSLSSGSDSSSR